MPCSEKGHQLHLDMKLWTRCAVTPGVAAVYFWFIAQIYMSKGRGWYCKTRK
jgi:hypothetical protein